MKGKLLLVFLVLLLGGGIYYYFFFSRKISYPFAEVIEHYSVNPADSLKLRAAEYLCEHAKYHFGIPNRMVDTAGNCISNFQGFKYSGDKILGAMDSLKYKFTWDAPVMDLTVLTPEYLIENIDLAFNAWAKPWAQHITFDQFCETLLPYRSHTEPISNWRVHLYEKYKWVADSVQDSTSAHAMMLYLKEAVKREVNLCQNFSLPYTGWLAPEQLENFGYGTCVEVAYYFTLVLRAMGVPANFSTARVSQFGVEHTCNLICSRDSGEVYTYYMGVYDERLIKVLPGSFNGPKMSRIRKRTFALRDTEPLSLIAKNNFPNQNLDLQSEDISWLCKSDTLRYELPDSVASEKYLYLCVFDRWKWLPMRYTKPQNGKVTFENTILQNLYTICTYKDGVTTPVTSPFVYFGGNDLDFRHETEEKETQIQLSYGYYGEKVLTRKVRTNYLDANNKWIPIVGKARLYAYNAAGILAPSDDTTSLLDRRYILTLKNIPTKTIFYDDSLYMKRPQGISRTHIWEPY